MSKILKVKIKREPILGGGTHYVYPPEYNAKKIQVLCYESMGEEDKVKARGDYEYCIGVVKDEDAPAFLKSNDIVEINETKAKIDGKKWRPQTERIIDEKEVLRICAKAVSGESLTQKEKDALNPDKAEIGVNKSKSFSDLLDEYKTKL